MTARDLGLLALRVGTGGTPFAHGAQKLFGWFGGTGLEQTGAMFEQLGFRPGKETRSPPVWAKPAAVRSWRPGSGLRAPRPRWRAR